ncbi:unnamed protein product [Lactuca virosa]|uniref:SNF2 N-terminal domain-containing protein n=1 Tax=Lactuca virosa TaxID=75947 RepID=A0AAU9MDC3_9ASTR|nr:unnamed protein product [Lactuca virosa]
MEDEDEDEDIVWNDELFESMLKCGYDELAKQNADKVETFDAFLSLAIAPASAVPDLRDHYDCMAVSIKSKLLPFQQEGVRFVLQHGGRVLLADDMGLGKSVQVIVVASCVCDSWPVLVLSPSSLRLQWASWLGIDSSKIHVVLCNYKQTWVHNNMGLEAALKHLSFKVVIANKSHFLKNARA